MKVGAVINNASGTLSPEKAEKRLEVIIHHLENQVMPECLSIVPGDQVKDEIKRVLDKGIEVLVIGGGDGTISTAAQLVANTDIALVVLAIGTKNNFARDAEIPFEPEEAIRLLDHLKIKKIDMGEVNDIKFINNASIGLYPDIVEEREEKTEKLGWSKWRAKITAVMVVLRRIRVMRMTVKSKDFRIKLFTPFLFVGNNEYENLFNSDFNRPSLNSGKIWLCMARSPRIWSLIIMAWHLGTRGIRDTENLDTRLLTEVSVNPRKRKVKVAIDGEIQNLYTPLRFKILKKSLRLVIP
ncbi:diacylglycerol kinase family protein [soil metagenome]